MAKCTHKSIPEIVNDEGRIAVAVVSNTPVQIGDIFDSIGCDNCHEYLVAEFSVIELSTREFIVSEWHRLGFGMKPLAKGEWYCIMVTD